MKTADSIEQQPERKAARDNGDLTPQNMPPSRVKMKKLDASRIAPWKWQAGYCPNPGGRPKTAALSKAYRHLLEEPCPSAPGKT